MDSARQLQICNSGHGMLAPLPMQDFFPSGKAENAFVEPAEGDYTLTVHGVFPPPVTGMSLCTRAVTKLLAVRLIVKVFDWSDGSPTITGRFRLSKAFRAITSPIRLLLGRRSRSAVFYTPCNAGPAFFFNLIAILAAKCRGYRCVLHHHYYHYLDHYQLRTQLFAWVLGPQDLQLVLCPDMEQRLRLNYGSRLPIAIIPSTIQLLSADIPPPDRGLHKTIAAEKFRLGLICNLQMSKGLDTVVDVLRELRRRGRDVQLVLAGPLKSNVEQAFLEAAQREFGEAIDYRGPVYGPEKEAFFRDLHVKLFPTRYPDAQPLVITEAFSYGCPVICYGRGCIPGMMPQGRSWSIPPGNDFIGPSVEQIEKWMDDSASYLDARSAAGERFDEMIDEARTSLIEFERWIREEQVTGFVRHSTQGTCCHTCEGAARDI